MQTFYSYKMLSKRLNTKKGFTLYNKRIPLGKVNNQ